MVLVPTTPGTLAVLIGAVELIILELFRATLNAAQAARRRYVLHRDGRLHLPFAAIRKARLAAAITVISLVVVAVIIVLELTIDGTTMRRASVRTQTTCFAPDRLTRYFGSFGAEPSEIEDPRFPEYLEQTECEGVLLADALSGASSLETGYPNCASPFGPVKRRFVRAELKGCVVGFVSFSSDGDFHCDVLPVGVDPEPSLAGSSFLAVLESGQNATSDLRFDSPEKRMLANFRIPGSWVTNNPENTVTVPCTDLDLDCYLLARERVVTAPKTVVRGQAPAGIYIQVLESGNSTVCLFENGFRYQAEWLSMNQTLPGSERSERNGPVLTGFQIEGDARCVEDLDYAIARMHYDAVETAVLPPETEASMVGWLQEYVVGTGIKTPSNAAIECEVFKVVEGSTLSRGWLTAALVLSAGVVLVSIVASGYAIFVLVTCSAKTDPLTLLWSIEQLLRFKGDLLDTVEESHRGREVYVGVVEGELNASFAVYPDTNFPTVRQSRLPFIT